MASTDKLVCVVGRDPLPAVTHLESGEQLHLTLIVPEGVSCERALEFHLDGPGASLDLAGGNLTLAAMPDFVNGLTNSANSRCTLTVPAGGRLDFTGLAVGGLEKVDLVVAQGGQIDLGGETVTVRRYTGAPGAVVNGTLVELKPLRGLFLMVR